MQITCSVGQQAGKDHGQAQAVGADLAVHQGSGHELQLARHDSQALKGFLQLLQAAPHGLSEPVEPLHLLAQHHRQRVELASLSALKHPWGGLRHAEQGGQLV